MSLKRTVVIIGSAYPLRGGGISTFNERLANAFSDRGDEVRIETFKLQYPSFFFPGKSQYSSEKPPEGLRISVTINSINPLNWILTGKKISRERPDLVIIRYWIPFMAPCFGTIARIICKNRHTQVISIADNIVPHEKMPGMKLLTSWFVKSVDGFVTMSRAVLQDLDKFDNSKPRIYCPHPLYDNFGVAIAKNEAKKTLNLDPDFGYLLFFGFIRDYKGLDLLIKSFADRRLQALPVKVLVAGEFYSDPQPYFDLIKKLKLSDRFIIRNNFIPNTEVYKYFSAADVVVQPYKEATQSGVTQVAYHFNKPMITTNVGGLSETVPNGIVGYVVEPDQVAVAEAIYSFYAGQKELEFSENVKEEKKKYSWANFLSRIDDLVWEMKLNNSEQ
jgi:D-inositol-3-phosphate glycosyltransferase